VINVKTKFIKSGYKRRSGTSKTAKIHRFAIFVMYGIITTVPVEFCNVTFYQTITHRLTE